MTYAEVKTFSISGKARKETLEVLEKWRVNNVRVSNKICEAIIELGRKEGMIQ